MKKALVVLLILAIAGGMFAQELTWSGAVKTGLQFTANDTNNGEDSQIAVRNDDAGAVSRFDLNAAYTKDNYGAVVRLRTDVDNGLGVNIHQAYGWATFLNDIIKVSAGIIDDGAWGSGGMEGYAINGTGVRFEIAPIEGLSLGLMLRVPEFPLTIKQYLSETAFGAKYESDLFWLAGGLTLDSDIDGLDTKGDAPATPPVDITVGGVDDSDHGLDFYAGLGVTALPGLTVSVEAKARNASKFAEYGQFVLDEKVSYKLLDDKLDVGLKAYQWFWGEDFRGNVNPDTINETLKPYLTFTPYVDYAVLDNLNVALDVGFGLWQDKIDYELSFKPKVTYKIGDGAKIVAFYKLAIEDLYKDNEVDGRKTNKGNTVQIDLIWEF